LVCGLSASFIAELFGERWVVGDCRSVRIREHALRLYVVGMKADAGCAGSLAPAS
jgi:hypothetical protein